MQNGYCSATVQQEVHVKMNNLVFIKIFGLSRSRYRCCAWKEIAVKRVLYSMKFHKIAVALCSVRPSHLK